MAKRKSTSEIKGELKTLKKSGLVDIDLRKVTDKQLADKKVRGGLLRTLSRFKDIVTGKAKTVKVSDKKAREAIKSRGYRTVKNGLVVIPIKQGEEVKADRKGNLTFNRVVTDRKSKRQKLEVTYEPNLNFNNVQTLEDAVEVYAQQYRDTDKKIGFTYYGNVSKETYSNVKDALLKVINYEQAQNVIGTSLDPANVPEALRSVQIIEYLPIDPLGRTGRAGVLKKDFGTDISKYYRALEKKTK